MLMSVQCFTGAGFNISKIKHCFNIDFKIGAGYYGCQIQQVPFSAGVEFDYLVLSLADF